jgi:hypothetical protein
MGSDRAAFAIVDFPVSFRELGCFPNHATVHEGLNFRPETCSEIAVNMLRVGHTYMVPLCV